MEKVGVISVSDYGSRITGCKVVYSMEPDDVWLVARDRSSIV